MSTLHDTIRTAVTALVGGRYYPNRFPQEPAAPTWPAIRGTIVSRENDAAICDAGDRNTDSVRVQIDVCAETYDATDTLFSGVCTALAATSPAFIRQPGAFDTWDADARVHRVVCDFVIHQSSPASS